jgi:2,3-bisphosphoglycerate-independent phosphoglycerate mutase
LPFAGSQERAKEGLHFFMTTPRKPVLLVIRDGWGKNPDASLNATNAIALARKPCDDR